MAPSDASSTDPVVIKVRRDGPYKITGPVTLTDADGNIIPTDGDSIVLCRCGRTATVPFCDRSHRDGVCTSGEA